jgi:hypothetical protein
LNVQLFLDKLQIVKGISLLFNKPCDIKLFFNPTFTFLNDLELFLLLFGLASTTGGEAAASETIKFYFLAVWKLHILYVRLQLIFRIRHLEYLFI